MKVCEKVESLEGQIREREKKGEEKKIRKRSSIIMYHFGVFDQN